MAANRTTGKTVKRRSVSKAASSGPVPPYGPAIWDAVHRGDLNEMKAVAQGDDVLELHADEVVPLLAELAHDFVDGPIITLLVPGERPVTHEQRVRDV